MKSGGTALSTYLGRTSRRTVSPTAQGTSVTSSISWVAPTTPRTGQRRPLTSPVRPSLRRSARPAWSSRYTLSRRRRALDSSVTPTPLV